MNDFKELEFIPIIKKKTSHQQINKLSQPVVHLAQINF